MLSKECEFLYHLSTLYKVLSLFKIILFIPCLVNHKLLKILNMRQFLKYSYKKIIFLLYNALVFQVRVYVLTKASCLLITILCLLNCYMILCVDETLKLMFALLFFYLFFS